jgi:amino-acid N-acetyltransferase
MIVDIPAGQFQQAGKILAASDLPVSDLHSASWFAFIGWQDQSELVATAGIENCNGLLLLRSVATAPSHRSGGIASALVKELHRRAKNSGFSRAYLLTLDAGDYFSSRFGYTSLERSRAPGGILQSTQFTSLCPESALLMGIDL